MRNLIKLSAIISVAIFATSCLGVREDISPSEYTVPTLLSGLPQITSTTLDVTLNASYSKVGVKTSISECGFYFGKEADMKDAAKLVSLTGATTFSVTASPREYGRTYYWQAFISNGRDEIRTSVQSFKMNDFSYYVSIAAPSASRSSDGSLTLSSNIKIANGIKVKDAGICYGTDPNLTIASQKLSAKYDKNTMSATFSGLQIDTQYYFRSYIQEGNNVKYSEVSSYILYTLPSLKTKEISDIESFSAKSGGCQILDNGHDITSKGVVWSLNQNPTIDLNTKTSDGTGSDDFSSTITDLQPATTYFVRAYAVSIAGVAYGEEKTFTTETAVPSVKTENVTEITTSSAKVAGSVTSDCGEAVTERGIVYSLSQSPTVKDSKVSSGIGIGTFEANISGLAPNTTYYVRAYAVNAKGISYGEEKTFKTKAEGSTEDVGNTDYNW